MRKLAILPFLALALSCDNSAPLAPDSQLEPAFKAASAAVKVYVDNKYEPCSPFVLEWGETWYTGKDDKVFHSDGYVSKSCFTSGDFDGELVVGPGKAMIDFNTGKGTWRGEVTYDVSLNGLSGTFVGTANAKYEGYVGGFIEPDRRISGSVVAHGTGDFEGMKYHNSFITNGATGMGSETGYILMPHGS